MPLTLLAVVVRLAVVGLLTPVLDRLRAPRGLDRILGVPAREQRWGMA